MKTPIILIITIFTSFCFGVVSGQWSYKSSQKDQIIMRKEIAYKNMVVWHELYRYAKEKGKSVEDAKQCFEWAEENYKLAKAESR